MARNSNELLERVYSLLPRTYQYADIDTKHQLKRYLEILVQGGIFPTYDETKGLMTLIDFDRVPAKFLPDLASALGFEFPYDLDEQTQRTYIKNAVISYKIKGTETALLFMIRELTRFKTWLDIDKETRHVDIYLEVDMGRQGFDRIVEKADFLLQEFAPPVKSYQIINVFIWFEDFIKRMSDEDTVTVNQYTSLDTDKWFGTNIGTLNDKQYTLTAEMEWYGYDRVTEAENPHTLNILDPTDILDKEFIEHELLQNMSYDDGQEVYSDDTAYEDTIFLQAKTDTITDGWFLLNDGLLNDTRYMVTPNLEKYDINGITSQYGYDIISKDEGDEHKTQVSIEELLDFTLTLQETETSTLSITETENPVVIQPHYDTEFTYLNLSTQLTTASNSEFYPTSKIVEQHIDNIIMV
jgi:phage tail-like protein